MGILEKCLNGRLKLTVVRAEGLKAMDFNGFSDPYVTVVVDGVSRVKTKYKAKTLNPEWNQYFLIRVGLCVCECDCGCVRVSNCEICSWI